MSARRIIWPLLALAALPQFGWAQPPEKSFSQLLTSKTAETFVAVREYLKTAPESDREAPTAWLLQTATEFGWESQVADVAESYVTYPAAAPATLLLAEQVRILGLAQAGKADESVQAFQLFVRKLRLRTPNHGSDLAQALAMQLQLRGDRDAAQGVYEKLNGAFFLNAEVKDWCDRRTKRLALSGKPAPEISGVTAAGERLRPAVGEGKVVLVDFWATNCRPCLEELPQLRELYAEFHPLGLEMVGVSFDEDPAVLAEFLERQKLPWTIVRNDQQTPQRYHVELIPCLVLIDAQGQVMATDVKVQHLRGALRQALAPRS